MLRGPEGTLDFGHIEEACAAALSGVGARLVLPGNLHLAVVHGSVALSIGVLTAPAEVPQLHCERLDLPDQGSVLLPNTGWSARVWEGAPAQGRWAICCDKDRLVGPLQLRRRRPGDRIRRSGGRGSRRLQDLFVDHKIPQEQRDGWPLLSSGDALVWVAGLALDPRFAPDEQTSNRVCVELEYQ